MKGSTVAALLQLGARAKDAWEDTVQDVLRIDADVLGVERASYWSLRETPPSLACELGYVVARPGPLFERGLVLLERDCPAYFSALRGVRVLEIADAGGDPRLAGLEDYIARRAIGAILDVPVFVAGRQVGVLCHEHVGSPRAWSERDTEFALAVSHAIASALEARARSQAEDQERRAVFLAETSALLAESFPGDRVALTAVTRATPTLGDIAFLVESEGDLVQLRAAFARRPEHQALVEKIHRRYPVPASAVHLGGEAMREHQSVLMPVIDLAWLREAGIPEDELRLIAESNVRNGIAVPLRVRGRVTGAMVFASEGREYDSADLRLADAFAHEVAVTLDNVRLYEQMRAAIGARDEFLRMASHELRTPLTALTLSADALAGLVDAHDFESVARLSAAIGRQAKRLARLVNRMLDASQIGAGELGIQPEEIDLAQLVRDVAGAFAGEVRRAGVDLVVDAEGPVLGRWDPIRMEHVVNNLLDNAVKFGAHRPIDVGVHAHGGGATLTVRDHGEGFSRHPGDDVFRRFRGGLDERAFGGLGVGLHVVHEIVAAHGGKVSAHNAEGGGTVVVVDLPGADASRREA